MLQPRIRPQPKPSRSARSVRKGRITSDAALVMLLLLAGNSLLIVPSLGLSQFVDADEPYIVKPTPTLRVGTGDLTTVLLVNNEAGRIGESYGRFLSVRPEVGLLTSTARTFIQEGITTEYATHVVGTTLDNGRLYAQYLTKSSRVLYDGEHIVPSVVTSWVGEGLQLQTKSVLQSHNDLIDAEAADWREIDDRLRVNHNEFVGNTDYVGLNGIVASGKVASIANSEVTHTESSQLVSSVSSVRTLPLNIVGRSGQIEENARKLAAQKVLPIGDLPTYTVKNHFEPSAYTVADKGAIFESIIQSSSSSSSSDYNNDDDGRSPKVFYQQVMNERGVGSEKASFNIQTQPKRIFSTVTYYGFADFTTIVGDSVIVFTPSTSQLNANYGHVTSIKGEATLGANVATHIISRSSSQEPISATLETVTSTDTLTLENVVSTIRSEDIVSTVRSEGVASTVRSEGIASTVINEWAVTTGQNYVETKTEEAETTTQSTNDDDDVITTEHAVPAVELHSSEVIQTVVTSSTETTDIESNSKSTDATPMFSLPTNEDILKIYASLAQAEVAKSISSSTNEVIQISSDDAAKIESQSSLQVHGGATTIFFEDDPFSNFLEPTPSQTTTVQAMTQTVDSSSVVEETTEQQTTESSEADSISSTTENKVDIEETTPIISSVLNTTEDSETTKSATTTKKSSEQELIVNGQTVIVKEINPDDDVGNDCSRTSQVFLTQLPNTLTVLNTHLLTSVTGDESIVHTSVETNVLASFDIKQTTKHYCIQATEVADNKQTITDLPQVENPIQAEIIEDVQQLNKATTTTISTTETIQSTTSQSTSSTLSNSSEGSIETTTEQLDDDETTTVQSTETEYTDDYESESEQGALSGEDEDESGEEIELIYKTLYTTYTYLTTFFQEDATTVSSHTEVVTNIITSTVGVDNDIKVTEAISENEIAATITQQQEQQQISSSTSKYMVPQDVDSYVRAEISGQTTKNLDELQSLTEKTAYLDDTKYTQTYFTTYTYYTTIFAEGETEIMSRTEVFTNYVTTDQPSRLATEVASTAINSSPVSSNLINTNTDVQSKSEVTDIVVDNRNARIAEEILTTLSPFSNDTNETADQMVTLVTDVRSSSSHGEKQVINKYADPIDDQVSSESNTEEIIPSATLLLQTSFTTFTYYTTMYVGENTNIISRLETVTNVATETLQPTKSINTEEATLPITYFTTFTYWTKLAKSGEITTISREETISNIVQPTAVNTISAFENTALPASNSAIDEVAASVITVSQINNSNLNNDSTSTSVLEPTTYYTTYTYYTTSYDVDKTITDSRFETITNVITPTVALTDIVASSSVHESSSTSTSIEDTNSLTSSQLNLVLYDYKKIIDAEGISTLYFTTQVSPTIGEDGSSTEITSSSSSLFIDETKKSLQATQATSSDESAASRQYKTGLVRLIDGTRIGNSTTTLYQSKVIGTLIDNRYAQIIESTSSFLFEKTVAPPEVTSTIAPTSTDHSILATSLSGVLATSTDVLESSINDADIHENTDELTEKPEDNGENNDDNLANSGLQTKKRTFAPVIRPFASRNRPTFAPKQKILTASSATIITRSDITPTITATPALKTGGRYSSSRRGSISNAPINLNKASSSRQFGRPPFKSSSISAAQSSAAGPQSSAGFAPSRSRFSSSRISPTSSSRRINAAFRPSSGLGFRAGLSSLSLPNSRQRIRPTASNQLPSSSIDATASVFDNSEEEENATQEQTNEEEEITTENSRRNQNPLLRFRRPLNRPAGFTPAQSQRPATNSVTISPKRNPLSARAKNQPTTTTTTTTTPRSRPRTFQRPTQSSLQIRARPQSNLFPPRGLFQAQKPQNQDNNEDNKNKDDDDDNDDDNDADNDSEYEDDDDSDDAGDVDGNRRRRSHTKLNKPDALTKLIELSKSQPRSRSRRQADARSRFRFRRPKTLTTTEDSKTSAEPEPETTASTPRSRTGSRFSSRYQNTHSQHTTTTAATTTVSHRAIRPTRPNTGRTQFTLREKDAVAQKSLTRPSKSNFRRPQSTTASLRRPTTASSSNRRLKSYNNADTSSSRNTASTRPRTNNLSGASRGRSTVRSRNRNDHNSDPIVQELGSASITVTHVIPAEVTIPVVNGQITEYKNIVTGKTSTEVVGPSQYTSTVGANGQTSLLLTREDTSVNFAGATEVTKYVLHDSATTTITFTPTTIRGRKTSFSHVLPSTVYSVENVISTLQPQISANAPLANILLSQLLLGNIGLPSNPLLGALGAQAGLTQQPQVPGAVAPIQATPVTEYRTHTSTYVTTIFDGKSTVVPVTFLGKKILTTVFDTTAQTITATEFITDTIVTTPTQQQQLLQPSAGQVAQVNSLLLQQLLLQQQPLFDQSQLPITHTASPQIFLTENLQDLDAHNQLKAANSNLDEIEEFVPIVEETHTHKGGRKKSRKSGKNHKKHKNSQEHSSKEDEASVVTLYVSGRRPGEFSTILSTVQNGYDHAATLHKRQAFDQMLHTATIDDYPIDVNDYDYVSEGSEIVEQYLLPNTDKDTDISVIDDSQLNHLIEKRQEKQGVGFDKIQTDSLESIVGDVSLWYAQSAKEQQSTKFAENIYTLETHFEHESTQTTHTHTKLSISSKPKTQRINTKSTSKLSTESVKSTQSVLKQRSHSLTATRRYPRSTFLNNNESNNQNSLDYATDGSFDEARYNNLATRVMSNGVEVIIAGDKSKTPETTATPWHKSSQVFRPMTLAASTLKNQMILALPSNIQENFTMPINTNQFITKTCLTTYTYRTTYLENGKTTVDSREQVISNIATEERNYLRISSVLPLGVTLTRTPELVVGVFPTTYFYYNTIREDVQPIVVTSTYTVTNTITGPDDYIAFLQPSEEATPTQDTNTYYSRVTLTKTIRTEDISQVVTSENILTQVIVTESYPARSTSILTSYYAYDTDESSVQAMTSNIQPTQPVIVTYMHTYTNEKGLERVETILKTLQKSTLPKESSTEDFNDVQIYATKTFLTTFTYYTTKAPMALSVQSEDGLSDTSATNAADFNYRTHVIENVVTDTVPSYLLRPELVSKFQTELMQKKGKNQRRVIVTVATLIGGQTLEVTAMKMVRPTTSSSTSTAPSTLKAAPIKSSTSNLIQSSTLPQHLNNQQNKSPNVKVATEKYEIDQDNQEEDNDAIFAESQDTAVYLVPPTTSDDLTLIKEPGANNKVVEQLPSAMNQILSSFNFQRLRPMISAVADLLQTNLKANRPNPTELKPQRLVESKNALQNLTEHPIYIPVQNGIQESGFKQTDVSNNNNNKPTEVNKISSSADIGAGKLTPHSLHITPPVADVYELSNDDNWLQEPSSPVTDYKTALINGGIPIRPGEVITTNSDVIIGRPNGIQFPRIPLQPGNEPPATANNIANINISTKQEPQQAATKVSYYQQVVQHPFRKKSSPLVTPNVIPLIAPHPAGVRLKEYTRQPLNENYDQILKPPPPPPATLLYPSTTLKYKPQKPTQPNMYRIKNEIIEIKPIPEVFTTSIPALTTSTYWLDNSPYPPQQQRIQKYEFKPSSTPLTKLDFRLNMATKEGAPYAAHQHISLKTDVLNHNVAMNVPPLTFKKETDDYPPAQAIHGHIAPDTANYQVAMPQVKIPPNEIQVNVNLTPQSGLGPITTPNENLDKSLDNIQNNSHRLQQQYHVQSNNPYMTDATAIGSFAVDLNRTYISISKPQTYSIATSQSSLPARVSFNYYQPNNNYKPTTTTTTTRTPIDQYKPKPTLSINYDNRQPALDVYSDEEPSVFSQDQKAAETINSFYSTNLSTLILQQSLTPFNKNSRPSVIPQQITTNSYSDMGPRQPLSKTTASVDTNENSTRLLTFNAKMEETFNKQLSAIPSKSSIPIVDGSPFVVNPKNLSKSKNQTHLLNAGQKNIFIAAGEGFKVNLKTTTSPVYKKAVGLPTKAFNSAEKTTTGYQNDVEISSVVLAPPLATGLPHKASTESKHYGVLGLSPPPPPTMTPTTPNMYSTLNYANKLNISPTSHITLTDELIFKGKSKSKQAFDKTFLKPPPPPPYSSSPFLKSTMPLTNIQTTGFTLAQTNKTVSQPHASKSVLASTFSTPLALSTKVKLTTRSSEISSIHITPTLAYNPENAQINPTRRQHPKLQATTSPFTLPITNPQLMPTTDVSLQPSEITTKTSTHSTKHLSNDFVQKAVALSTMSKRPIKTLKRIILPTKYITNTKIHTVVTTKTTVLIKTVHNQPAESPKSSMNSVLETIPPPPTSTYLITKTHTILNTVTEIRTTTVVQEMTATAITETINVNGQPTSTLININATATGTDTKLNETSSSHQDTNSGIYTATVGTNKIVKENAGNHQDNFKIGIVKPDTIVKETGNFNANTPTEHTKDDLTDIKEGITSEKLDYFEAQPSVEVVFNDNQLHQQEQQRKKITASSTDQDQSSIFIVMTNNNLNNGNEVTNTKQDSKIFEFSDDVHQSLDVPLDYDSSISFELPSRDEETSPLDANSGRQVLLGGVLIASPPKLTTNNNEGSNAVICQPLCKSTRNEVCAIAGSRAHCVCRPGFARMFPDRPCKPTYTFKMSIETHHIGNYQLKYTEPLKNNASDEYRHLSSIILDAVDRMVMQSDFRDVYHGVQLIKFEREQSSSNVLAEFLLQLSDTSDEKRLQSVFKKYLRQSNYSIGGTELYTSRKGMQYLTIEDFDECVNNKFHDCSNYAQCFNLQGTYTCSCQDGYADMSPNAIYPGRICSEELVGCEKCHYHGNCATTQSNPEATVCECFPWHTGASCQVNLKILLISMIAVGTLLFLLLLFCLLLAYTKRRRHRNSTTASQIFIASSLHQSMLSTPKKSRISKSIMKTTDMHIRPDKHAMIQDTSSESSHNSLPYVLKYKEPLTNTKTQSRGGQFANSASRIAKGKQQTQMSYGALETGSHDMDDGIDLLSTTYAQKTTDFDQTDRSLTVMIPRAKYHHPSVLPPKYLMHHQLTLEREETTSKVESIVAGVTPSHSVAQFSTPLGKRRDNTKAKILKKPTNVKNYMAAPGALVSAGFEVSAIVSDLVAVMNKTPGSVNSADKSSSFEHMLSTTETTAPMEVIVSDGTDHHSENNALRENFDVGNREQLGNSDKIDLGSFQCSKQKIDSMWISKPQKCSVSGEARSLDETTVQAITKPIRFSIETQTYNTNDEANTMAERDVGSTFLLPHTHLYEPEKESEVSEFDSI